MSDENETVRRNMFSVSPEDAHGYADILKASKSFEFKSYLAVSENCHLERYRFTHCNGKLVIVYDTKAFMLSFSGKPSVLTDAFNECKLPKFNPLAGNDAEIGADFFADVEKKEADNDGVSKQSSQKNEGKTDKPSNQKADRASKSESIKNGKESKPSNQKSGGKAQKPNNNKGSEKSNKPDNIKNGKANNDAKTVSAAAVPQEKPEYKNGYAVKKCPQNRIDGFIQRIKSLKGVIVAIDGSASDDIVTYTITDKKSQQRCLLRYTPKSQSAQLQGKRSNLFGEVQVILSSGSDFSEAMGSHIKLTGEPKRAGTVQRDLRKLLPDAFDLLGEPSKIDLGIGMIDIGNDDVKLSDYSVLLVPPYRGLERFIFDLHKSRGIEVKMIGQAYEKDDAGNYVLKSGYRKKNGVVYSEVMSALYAEYFAQRNFYAHSDNTDMGATRVISDKSAAKQIFGHLCEVINYNAKKLKEIGFTVRKPTE